ncbi:VOC family protein [Novosphingobium resinovorum]|uniref:Biphenyl 2,3-dioxygenase n=1 Tax=Novosphingobium resinovorum TaxID=158500 RepID=A0A031JKF9_9SPHN|nr:MULTISPECIES: VOC family protein [Novosphingobium]AOR78839.1 biphenyl 2,3-dioxygenase [Novosphingobium resinovorum]EZP73185.1 putative ring-cleavage extradiol dioxygenase [Novosphingobium resinovorum]MBF7014361.1 VOC family protein [Novosphingobium sp. HR1a]WJM25156.1 VOC family protein [Novosphingobium resinovorum]
MTQQSTAATETAAIIPPVRLAHFVLRTSRFREVIDWYKTVLGAEAAFENEILAFLSYDEEHHRVAVLNMPDLEEQKDGVAGFHHAAFTYDSLGDLMATYKRLRDVGITPVFPINHGPTTSMYYQDPDGNQIELQVDNYDNIEDATAFFYSPAFAENPIGVEFDPEDLLRRVEAGEDQAVLKRRPDIGQRGLEAVKLR